MFTRLIPRGAGDDGLSHDSGLRLTRRRLGAALAVASALAMGFAMMMAPQPASALSVVDGQWTVVHGGTGLVTLNTDGTYESTCVAFANYEDAYCPAPSGIFRYSTASVASVTFTGSDGTSTSYRVSGLASNPDSITSVFGSRTYSPLVMQRGDEFTCTYWSGTGTSFTRWGISPLVQYDAATNLLYATGSHELIGPKNIDTQVNLVETAPNYFHTGSTCILEPPATETHHVGDLDSAAIAVSSGWLPQVEVAVLDANGVAVSGATVSGTFTTGMGTVTCTTTTDGTCIVSATAQKNKVKSSVFTVTDIVAASSAYASAFNSDADGDSNGTSIKVNRP